MGFSAGKNAGQQIKIHALYHTGHQDQLAPTSSLSDHTLKTRCLTLAYLPLRLLGIKPDPACEAPYYMEGGMSIWTGGNVSGKGFGHN